MSTAARTTSTTGRTRAHTAAAAARAVEGGGRILLSPQSHLYLDRPYAQEVARPDQAGAAARLGFTAYRPRGVRHTAEWDPASHGIPRNGSPASRRRPSASRSAVSTT
ncbi:hypothetical protein [Streptomyces sp. NPDC002644]